MVLPLVLRPIFGGPTSVPVNPEPEEGELTGRRLNNPLLKARYRSIGRLDELLDRRFPHLTQRDRARVLGLSADTLRSSLAGGTKMNEDTVRKMEQALGAHRLEFAEPADPCTPSLRDVVTHAAGVLPWIAGRIQSYFDPFVGFIHWEAGLHDPLHPFRGRAVGDRSPGGAGAYALLRLSCVEPVDLVFATTIRFPRDMNVLFDYGIVQRAGGEVASIETHTRRAFRKRAGTSPVDILTWVGAEGALLWFRANRPVELAFVEWIDVRTAEARLANADDPAVGFVAWGKVHVPLERWPLFCLSDPG